MSLLTKNKKEKTPKLYSVKKLPSKLKKTYTEKKLNKKLLKKFFIPSDKELVQNLFKESGTNKKGVTLYAVPKDQTFTKKEIKHLKKILKEIKKQKGRIKFVPLIAVAVFITVLVSGIMLTKNIIAKKIIQTSVEAIAEARCDIQKVDIKFFDSTFKLTGLQVANKNEPMKNLFSISSITFDFDLLQLLKSRFVANELSVYGVEINSDRTYSGTLPPKKAKKIKKQKKAKVKKERKESPLINELKSKSLDSLNNVQKSLEDTFAQYNPETMFTNFYGNLQTPAMADRVQKEIEALVNKYMDVPALIEADFKKGEEQLNSIININYEELLQNPVEIVSPVNIDDLLELQKMQNPEEWQKPENIAKIIKLTQSLNIKKPEDLLTIVEVKPSVPVQNTIDTVTNAYNYALDVTKQGEQYAKDIQSDINSTAVLFNDVTKVITKDTNYVQGEIKKITSFKIEDGMAFISGTIDSMVCQLLGKYYPYVIQATDYLIEMKNNKKEKKARKPIITVHRAEGRNIYYKNDKAPELWIKKVAASGTGFSAKISNITNNMDIINKPTAGDITLSLFGLDHNASVVVDTRSKTEAPLVTVDYNTNQIPLSLPVSYFNNTPGVPGIDHSQVALDFILKVFEDEGFSLEGKSNFTDTKLTTTPFEPYFISNIYENVLAEITGMDLDFTTDYTVSNGFNMGLYSNIDKLFMAALEKEIRKQLEILKAKIEAEVVAKINELTNGMFGEFKNFEDIQNKVNEGITYLEELPKEIEKKKVEMENLVKNSIEETQKQLMAIVDAGRNQLQSEIDAKMAEIDKAKQEMEAELLRKKQEAEEEFERQKQAAQAELERKQKEAEAELERQKQAAAAEAERLRKEAEEAARQKAKELEEEAKRKAAEEARKQLKKFF